MEGADVRALPRLWPPRRKVLQEGSGGWARREREVKVVLGLIFGPKEMKPLCVRQYSGSA